MADRSESSRDLLFGMIALEGGYLDQAQLVAGFRAWKADPKRSLASILAEQGTLSESTRTVVEGLLTEHLAPRPRRGSKRKAKTLDEPMPTVTHEGPALSKTGEVATGLESPAEAWSGRFRVLRPHARGGLGEVFLALDPELNRTVALKELQAERAFDPGSQARFLLEAELTGRLEHPGIVPVYGLGRYADGRPYYAMRFIEGETLRAAIERFHQGKDRKAAANSIERELAFRRLLGSLIDACNAVAFAHSRGVVHRDLKPENIMLGRFGETLVVDWGIAKPLQQERAGGEDARDWPTLESRAGEASLTRPGAIVGTPRYMSPEQAAGDHDRVGTASDIYSLGATLFCLLTGKPPFTDNDVKRVLHKVSHGIFPAPRRLKRDLDPALEATCLRAMSLKPEERHASALDLARELEAWLADVRYRGEQEQALSQMKGSLARLCLERAYALFQREMQAEGMLWLARALEHAPPELERPVRTGLYGWHSGEKLLERSLKHGSGAIHHLTFCIEGRRLATAGIDGKAQLWDVATGTLLFAPLEHRGPVRSVAFHPDGKRLATASEDGTIRQWSLSSGEPEGAPLVLKAPVTLIAYSADGSTLATACDVVGTFLWETETGRPISPVAKHGSPLRTFAFAPDGATLAVPKDDRGVALYETATGRLIDLPIPHEAEVTALKFSPDGRSLLTGGLDGKARLWDLEGGVARVTIDHRSPLAFLDFDPDGTVIAAAGDDSHARLWNAATGRPIGEPLTHELPVSCLSFTPDGSTLATGSQDGTVRLWDAATALPISPALLHRGAITALSFTLDGRRLATACADGFARCWQIPIPLEGPVERISCWVGVTGDLEFDEGDAIRRMDGATSWTMRRRLVELGGPPVRDVTR
ncbi:WD40 repeat domain-containing serine/threonine protein kinase [Singulisphaera sp. PoT]|uniref:WD40 repeat domain-containing serine/threonine protein kinase n=1 Tax=Singulisphaera sp. PoT TaxID=3411797 RepID=UPI003BF46DEE